MLGLNEGRRGWDRRPHYGYKAPALAYDAQLESGSALGRTRRVLREIAEVLRTRAHHLGPNLATRILQDSRADGRLERSFVTQAALMASDPFSVLTDYDALIVVGQALADLDGMACDLDGPGGYPAAPQAIRVADHDPELAGALSEASRCLREGKGAAPALHRATRRIEAIMGRGIVRVAQDHSLGERAGHLASVAPGRGEAYPSGTVAFALVTVEALVFRLSRSKGGPFPAAKPSLGRRLDA